ncbi:hydrogenase formation protein HypD [Desulfovibrio litoralis]|uniref:Hydrogenase expression/formation protein HypD n=1 Tax=Desulfovibrio litoralis DSM 11393 TaxID=1121455 RepID=A0A1M7SDD1_9BACT|nr:hydrogenase formation protein HypD [Desulfovibrio litoralis]SHN56232.1 hydrogenase expression/formation protein HypD [Desulfovibrio litoralis DSM 11393]
MFNQEAFHNPELCAKLLDKLEANLKQPLTFMEVCGTHTMSIFQSGLKGILPKDITHLSGPGCPVCVTHDSEVMAFLDIASQDKVIVATFGDLMRVPSPDGRSLKTAQANGAKISVLYSPFDALELAQKKPDHLIVFLSVGFETTTPLIAATIQSAEALKLNNFAVFCANKLVPPVLSALLSDKEAPKLDALLLPGHVSTVIGVKPYEFLITDFKMPSVIGGFEPADILESLIYMSEMQNTGKPKLINQYTRLVAENGNPKACAVMNEVFEVCDGLFRGIGSIPEAGMRLREKYARFDALKRLGLTLKPTKPLAGCSCGEILKGKMQPNKCPLFGKICTPANPVGPCMVSSEGSCAAYYKYNV